MLTAHPGAADPSGQPDAFRLLALTLLLVLTPSVACSSAAVDLPEETESCDRPFGDPASSDYVLPFPQGRTYNLFQGNCPSNPTWGHFGWFAYDFDLVTGDTIIASRAGRVRFVREDQPDIGGDCSGGKENMVFIEHTDGTVMAYVHLTTQGSLVAVGDNVTQGQPIGLSGNSGCSSGPHLHVTLYRAGNSFDHDDSLPLNYRNALGPVDANGGLVQGAGYTAGPFEPGT